MSPNADNIALAALPILLVCTLITGGCVYVLSALLELAAVPVSHDTVGTLWLVSTLALAASLLTLGIVVGKRARNAALQRELDWVSGLPFVLRGHMSWLANTFDPWWILCLDFRSTPDQALVVDAIHAVLVEAELNWAGSRQLRIKVREREGGAGDSRLDNPRADVEKVHALTQRVLLPLHRQYGIERAQWLEPGQIPSSDADGRL